MFRGVLFIAILSAVSFAPESSGQGYFWRDANGRAHYGDQCPAAALCQITQSSPGANTSQRSGFLAPLRSHGRGTAPIPSPVDTTPPSPTPTSPPPPAPPTADTTAPSTPSGLAASALGTTSLTLSWSPATDDVGVAGYRVYRSGTLVASPTSTSVAISGLLAGTSYSFAVSAFDAAGNASPASASLSVTTLSPLPPPTAEILWSAGMEGGSLVEFEAENNSGSADSIAVLASSEGIAARRGSWMMKQSVLGTSGGTRMYRNSAINSVYRNGNPIYYSFWAYFPQATRLNSGGWFNLLQIQSTDPGGGIDPVWILGFHPSNFTLRLEWWGSLAMTGPHAGESGARVYDQPVAIPVGQWVFIQVMVTPREDYTGAVKVWMNDQVVFDITNVKTKYPEGSGGGQRFFISKNAYGQNMTPAPNHHYVDDVSISLDPLPYTP